METPAPINGQRILRLVETGMRTGKSRSGIYRGVADGTFPQPVQISERSIGFLQSEVEQWISARPRAGVPTYRHNKPDDAELPETVDEDGDPP